MGYPGMFRPYGRGRGSDTDRVGVCQYCGALPEDVCGLDAFDACQYDGIFRSVPYGDALPPARPQRSEDAQPEAQPDETPNRGR